MAKFKGGFGIDTDAAINADPGDIQVGYTGETPPGGLYRGTLKRVELSKTGPDSKNPGTPMLVILVEIDEPEDSKKAKYNKYGIWNRQTITDQSAPFVNQFLASLVKGDESKFAAVKKWFWGGNLTTENPDGGHIHAIGKLKIGSPEGKIQVVVNTKLGRTSAKYPDPRLEISRWLVPSDQEQDDNMPDEGDDFDEGSDLDEGEEFGDEFGDEFD